MKVTVNYADFMAVRDCLPGRASGRYYNLKCLCFEPDGRLIGTDDGLLANVPWFADTDEDKPQEQVLVEFFPLPVTRFISVEFDSVKGTAVFRQEGSVTSVNVTFKTKEEYPDWRNGIKRASGAYEVNSFGIVAPLTEKVMRCAKRYKTPEKPHCAVLAEPHEKCITWHLTDSASITQMHCRL